MSHYKLEKQIIKNLSRKFTKWEIIKIRISTQLLSIIDTLPKFQNGFIADTQYTIENILKRKTVSYKLPEKDDLKLLYVQTFDLIPLEEKEYILNNIFNLIKKYPAPMTRLSFVTEQINDYDSNVLGTGWMNLGTISTKKYGLSNNFNFASFSILKISESWGVVSVRVFINENFSKELIKKFNEEYVSLNLYSIPKLKYWKYMWPHRIISTDSILINEVENLFEKLYIEIVEKIMNPIKGFLTNENIELPKINIFKYKKYDKEESKEPIKNIFWDFYDFIKYFPSSYSNSEENIHISFPERLKFSKDSLNTLNIYFNEDKTKFDSSYINLENFIDHIFTYWVSVLSPLFLMGTFIEELLRRIVSFRNLYFLKVKKYKSNSTNIINPKYQDYLRLVNYFERLRNELNFEKINLQAAFAEFPEFINKIQYSNKIKSQSNFIEDVKYNIDYKFKKANEIINFLKSSIKDYYNFHITKANLNIQNRLLLLTIITLFIGIISFFGKEEVSGLFKMVHSYLFN